MSQEQDTINTVLENSKTIAVVGLSARPERPSHMVAEYMQQEGYRIVPVNPAYAGTSILGETCYATLRDAAQAAGPIDIVDCFRQSASILPITEEAISIGARCLWMQLGVINEDAARTAEAAGMQVVMDRCIKIEHMARQP
jgi:predicted CoA-binding protein